MNTKLHAVTDAQGRPIRFFMTAGQVSDYTGAAALLDLGEQYARSSGYPIQYQWTLLAGINDSLADIERLAGALQGKYAMMNFIPFNRVEGSDFERPSMEHAQALTRCLRRRGIIACLRDSAGQEIEGGCGQLRARVLESSG